METVSHSVSYLAVELHPKIVMQFSATRVEVIVNTDLKHSLHYSNLKVDRIVKFRLGATDGAVCLSRRYHAYFKFPLP
jgi:hypothetical protein